MLQLLVLVLIGGYLTTNIVQSTFATDTDKKPNVIITINSDGEFVQKGDLFGDDELLYPATIEDAEKGRGGISGVIRIDNQYKKMDVTNLGVGLDKGKLIIGNGYPIDIVYNSFLNDVELKIEKGRLFAFDKTLVDYISIRELLDGHELDKEDIFTITKGNTVDLKYTLRMVENAGEELESVTAGMPILINVEGDTIIDDGGGNGRDDDTDDNRKDKKEKEDNQKPTPTDNQHWSHDCIITLLNHGVITGYPHEKYTIEDYFNGTVDSVVYVNEVVLPDEFVTRAETSVLVYKALGLEQQDVLSTEYVDYIPDWAKGYIAATTKAGIFTGYPTGEFKPENYITREEMIVALTKAFDVRLDNKNLEILFKDKDEIGNWASEYVKAGYEDEIIVGYPYNTYRPKNPITRGETFTIICKLKGWHNEHSQ